MKGIQYTQPWAFDQLISQLLLQGNSAHNIEKYRSTSEGEAGTGCWILWEQTEGAEAEEREAVQAGETRTCETEPSSQWTCPENYAEVSTNTTRQAKRPESDLWVVGHTEVVWSNAKGLWVGGLIVQEDESKIFSAAQGMTTLLKYIKETKFKVLQIRDSPLHIVLATLICLLNP